MRYRVDLEELLAFVDELQAFEHRAEATAARIDAQIRGLHGTWSGEAAAAHRTQHEKWMAGAAQMCEALGQLRDAATNAHRNYTDAAQTNVDMLR